MSSLAAFFAQTIQGLLTTRYAELASSVIIVYDHLVTLDQEVELIWKAGWSFGKCLFLMNRYYALFVVIFNNYVLLSGRLTNEVRAPITACRCVSWFRWQGVTGIIAFTLGELILQLRLYALYSLNRRVMALMGSIFAVTVISSAVIMGIALANIQVSTVSLFGFSFCAPLNLQQITYFYAFWIPVMVSESLLCCLVLLKAVRGWKRKSNLLDSGREIIAVLIRDSVIYFLVLFVVYLTNTILFAGGDITKMEAAVSYAVSMSCVMGSRLCLNVRGMIWRDEDIVVTPAAALPPLFPSTRSTRSRTGSRSHRSQASGGRSQTSQLSSPQSPQKWPVVVCAQPGAESLTEYEMGELRSMRAEHRGSRMHPLAAKICGRSEGSV